MVLGKGKIQLEFGWFKGSPFQLLNLTICGYELGCDELFVIFSIQIFKFSISIHIEID